jgi:hypothetical protein
MQRRIDISCAIPENHHRLTPSRPGADNAWPQIEVPGASGPIARGWRNVDDGPVELLLQNAILFRTVFRGLRRWLGATGPELQDAGQLEAPSKPRMVRWVGAVEDSDVRAAILVGSGKARLFFCGGAESLS